MTLQFCESAARAVFNASWQAGMLAVVVLVVCRVFTRVPAAVRCCLWLVVLVRFLLPALPQSPTSLFNVANLSTFGTFARADVRQPPTTREAIHSIEPVDTSSMALPAAVVTRPTPSVGASTESSRIASIAIAVWFLGFLSVSGQIARSFVALRRLLRRCRPVTDEKVLALLNTCCIELSIRRPVALHVAGWDAAPALAGIVFPRILISQETLDSLTSDELRWLFLHELTHARRCDLLVQRLWDLACAIHWFNPLAWWAASNARRAAELGCDEALLRNSAATERTHYGEAILNMAESLTNARPIRGAVGFLVREPALAGRIRAIASYRQRSRLWVLGGSMLLAALVLAGLTDALENRGVAQQPGSPSTAKTPPSVASPVSPSRPKVKLKIDPKELATTKGQIRILVLESDGSPVAGAEVFANIAYPGDFRWEINNHTYWSDADGIAVVKLPPKVGITKIWASKKGNPGYPDLFACWFPEFQTDANVIPEEFTFQPPLTVIGGIVQDENGKPIRGVTVDLQFNLDPNLVGMPAQRPVFDDYYKAQVLAPNSPTTTDSKGRWLVENVPLGAHVVLKLSHPGFETEEIWRGRQRSAPSTDVRPMPTGRMLAPPGLLPGETSWMQALRDQAAKTVMRRIK